MTNPTPPDSYWQAPDARPDEVYEEATWQADLLCAEWAELAELELFIDVTLNRGNEPMWELELVQRDGVALDRPGLQVEDLAEIRTWLEKNYPLPKEE